MSIQVSSVPAGFRAVPIRPGADGNPLNICALVRNTPDAMEGALVLLRTTADAQVYLGCINDVAGSVREWLEIWVQTVAGLEGSFSSTQEGFSKQTLDQRWKQETGLFAELEQDRFLHTGWEDQPNPPASPEQGTTQAPFNAEGGFMRVLNFCPLSFERYVDLLGSEDIEPGASSKLVVDSLGIRDPEALQQRGALLFGNVKEAGTKLPEVFYLKVQLLRDALRKVLSFVERQQLPFLNLSAESFRVRLGRVGAGLPAFWTAEVALVKTGNSHALNLPATEARYFARTRRTGESIYLPEGISRFIQGSGVVRIRKIAKERGGNVVEGTLVPDEPRKFSPNDLLWLRLPLAGGKVDLYGHLYETESLATGEVRFVTLPQEFPAQTFTALNTALGASLPPTPFELVPVLSSPCDLYSFGVLAARCLLVNTQNSLAIALDELLSLAREAGNKPGDPNTLTARVAEVFRKEDRFKNALGPHRLLKAGIDPKTAFQFLPEDLWFELLAVLIRFFPGASRASYCKDFGDAPPLALEAVLSAPIADLDKVLLRARSLVFIDWNANREMHSIIRQIKKGLPKT